MASKLTELRKQARLTQADLAQSLGITQTQVSKYEINGEIPTRLLRAWANAIGCPIDDLLPPAVKEETIFDFDNSLYGSLIEDLNLLQQYIVRFDHLIEESSDIVPTVKQFEERVIALKEKPWVVLTGRFDAGKSHLCNFYLGEKWLPTGYRPVTKYPTFVRHISDRPQWLKEDLWLMGPEFDPEKWNDKDHCTDNRILAGSWDTLEQHATLKNIIDHNDGSTPLHVAASNNARETAELLLRHGAVVGAEDNNGVSVIAFVDAPLLHSCVLVDLPGYGDQYEDENKKRNIKFIDELNRRASILLYLSPAQGFLDYQDFVRLGHLLHKLPQHKDFPPLGNLFIIASHAHPGIQKSQLEDEILKDGHEDFYEHFKENLFRDRSISPEETYDRFFSFYQEIPARREKLEQGLKLLLEDQMPSIKKQSVKQEILRFKEEGPAIYAQKIVEYEKILRNKQEAKRHYDRLEREEPDRKKRHASAVNRIEQEIIALKKEDLKNFRAVFEKKTKVEELETMIEDRYDEKKKAQNQASAYVLAEIQYETERFRNQLVDKTSNLIEGFVKEYDKLGDGGIRELSEAWTATLGKGNPGRYIGTVGEYIGTVDKIIAPKRFRTLAAWGVPLYTLWGGALILEMLAVALGTTFSWLFVDSWQRRLAKKIKNLLDEHEVLSIFEEYITSFWEETRTAFKKGADSLDKQHNNYIKDLKDAFGGSQTDIKELEDRLKRYEEIKSFFAAIPWRYRKNAMPSPTTTDLPIPKSWDEFEDIGTDLLKRLWCDPYVVRNGRSGQRQHGVDIYGKPVHLEGHGSGIAAAQCKRVEKLTEGDIRNEIEQATEFVPKPEEYLIFTTLKRDASLQEYVRTQDWPINRVEILFWEDLSLLLSESDELLQKYYPGWFQTSRQEPPDRPGLYRFRDKLTGKIDYIGESENLKHRISQHLRSTKPVSRDTHDVEWQKADGRSTSRTRREHERVKIDKHKPRLNKRGGGGGQRAKR